MSKEKTQSANDAAPSKTAAEPRSTAAEPVTTTNINKPRADAPADQPDGTIGNETESQRKMREYHETTFQTKDPITGKRRDLDETVQPARIDRGETLDDGKDR